MKKEIRLKVLFMGSPEISVPFLEYIFSKKCDVIVFTQKDKVRKRGKKLTPTPVSIKAEDLGLPVYKMSVKSKEAFEVISTFKPDLFLVVAYGQIIPLNILKIPSLYPVNVHFSLLPQYRGATPVNSAILEGRAVTGTSIMAMDEKLDTGDILFSQECDIGFQDNATDLFEKLIAISIDLLEKNWGKISSGSVVPVPQSGTASYTKLIDKKDLVIDFNKNCFEVHNRIRAFNYEPGIKTYFRDKTLFIENSNPEPEICGEPGKILSVDKKSFIVGCGNGSVRINNLKPEGKKSMSANSFINGYKPLAGEKLG
jgi:methionyl-tRNA formyltransferase